MTTSESYKMIPLLEEILKWIKFEQRRKAIGLFKSELDSPIKKLVYELSDGKSSPEIAKTVKIDSSAVRDYWHRWAEKGMMEICQGYKRRYCRIFSLKELGIEIPELEPQVSEEKEREDE